MLLTDALFIYVIYSCGKVLPTDVDCNNIRCSSFVDPVCGLIISPDGTYTFEKYLNLCNLIKYQCEMKRYEGAIIKHVPDKMCNIKKSPLLSRLSRKSYDMPGTGGISMCNHTCPLNCPDFYDPVCAGLYTKPGDSINKVSVVVKKRMMINHCHVDLFSCTRAINVTIYPTAECQQKKNRMWFYEIVAGLKALRLIPGQENMKHLKPQDMIHY